MLGIGMQEILIILVVALIVIGPKRLPELAKTLGKGFAEFRKAADDLQETVRMDLQKEKTEEFRQKYPDLVPEKDDADSAAPSDEPEEPSSGDSEAPRHGLKDGEPAGNRQGTGPAPDAAAPPEPGSEPSYSPEEIEGGDETEDETRDA